MKKLFFLCIFVCYVILTESVFSQDIIIKEGVYKTTSGKTLEVYTTSGDVIVNTAVNDEVSLKVFGTQEEKNNIDFLVYELSTGVKISILCKDRNNALKNNLKIELTVPVSYNAEVKTAGGDIRISNLTGDLNLTTAGGNITVKDVTGKINLTTAGGEIETYNVSGELLASSSGGNVTINARDCKIQSKTNGGNMELSYFGVNKGIDMKTNGGNIKVYIPDNFNADCTLRTLAGEMSCEFELRDITRKTESEITGRINSGGDFL